MERSVGYICYIDEAGDDGLKTVRPVDPNGASEWFTLSAVVVRVQNEAEVLPWAQEIVRNIDQHQKKDIHFRNLNDNKKRLTCSALSNLPIRCFVVLSNKRNMRSYKNENAAKVPSRNWFYCWIGRLLLERVTKFCLDRSIKDYGAPRTVRFVFSQRGGMSYTQFQAYLNWLKMKSQAGNMFLKQGDISWEVVDYREVYAAEHQAYAGLQLADIVASAFFQALETMPSRPPNSQFAEILRPRMWTGATRRIWGSGVKLMPNFSSLDEETKSLKVLSYYKHL